MTEAGILTAFFNLPRDDETASKSIKWFFFFQILWAFLFFVVAPRHPLPAFVAKKLKTKDDFFHVGHRIVCMY